MSDALTPRETGGLRLLDHLEALRRLLLKMAGVLLLTSALCFAFSDTLMALLRRPAEQVQNQYESEHLPSGITLSDWQSAKALADLRPALSAVARTEAEPRLSPAVRQLADTVPLLRAAALLPEAERESYLTSAAASPQEKEQLLSLYRSGALLSSGQPNTAQQLMGSFRPAEAFLISLNLSVCGGLVLGFPFLLALVLRFAAPGLMQRERRLLLYLVLSGTLLFLAGSAFAYFAVLPRVLHFFFTYALELGVANDWRIGYYLSFAAKLVFIFGLLFELPVLLLPLIRLRILTYELMHRTRRYAMLLCTVAALILAPAPDPGTMLLLALPMYGLYELCILLARFSR